MYHEKQVVVESDAVKDFTRVMAANAQSLFQQYSGGQTPVGMCPDRLNIDRNNVKNGLGQLVLTLVNLLHELLERQAIRRIEADTLSDIEIERLGETLMRQAQEIDRLRKVFGLDEEDLNLDLGPLGKLL